MAIIKKILSEIVEHNKLSEEVYSLSLKSLKGKYKFYPGQFLHLAIDKFDEYEQWPDSRCFSLQSEPNTDIAKITYAIKGHFTKRMANELKIGDKVTLKLPYGELLRMEHNKQNTIFIAGGTGVTPFLSLFNSNYFRDYENPVLFLGLKSKELNFYNQEFKEAIEINNGFQIQVYYENINGLIDIKSILDHSTPSNSFFISGPPQMIHFYKQSLLKAEINKNRIFTDDWE